MAVVTVAERHLLFTGRTPQPDRPVVVQVAFLDLIGVRPLGRSDAHGHCLARSTIINDTPVHVSLRDLAQEFACICGWEKLSCCYVNSFPVCSAALAVKEQSGKA